MKRRDEDLFAALGLPATPPVPRMRRGRPGPVSASGRAKKGGRVEREIAALIRTLGIPCEKVPLSGALAKQLGPDYSGDLRAQVFGPDAAPLVIEVKSRASGTGFVTLERWLASCDLLILKRNNAPPMVTLPWCVFARLIAAQRG